MNDTSVSDGKRYVPVAMIRCGWSYFDFDTDRSSSLPLVLRW
jgi:hypothetical protein